MCLWYIIHIILNLLSSFNILGLGFGMESRTSVLDAIISGLDVVVG